MTTTTTTTKMLKTGLEPATQDTRSTTISMKNVADVTLKGRANLRRSGFEPGSSQVGPATLTTLLPAPATKSTRIETAQILRARQVNEMIAGKKPKPTYGHWIDPKPETLKLWHNRHSSYTTFTRRYMDSQRRVLFLADVPAGDRFEVFEHMCYTKCLAPTTGEGYWTTWLGVQKSLGIKPSEADQRISKILKARSTAYPIQLPTAATLSDMETFVQTYSEGLPSLAAVGMLAFLNGQRISDMIQLAVADLQVDDRYLMITVRRGKTMMTMQPYTLWMRRNTYPTETIIKVALHAKSKGRLFLFSELNQEDERQKVLHTIRDMITSINDQLELRSFRRGGLQRMAQLGMEMSTILQFSRHVDMPMLMRYLNWGEHAALRQQEMIAAIDRTSHDMMAQEKDMANASGTTQL